MECYSRRDNIIFDGLTESQPEDCEEKVKFILSNKMGIPTENMKFVCVHRLGKKLLGKSRPVITKFHWYGDRRMVWERRSQLKGSNIWISEDFPQEIRDRRSILKPILHKAIELDPKRENPAYLTVDKLVIGKQTYRVDTLKLLPPHLNPTKIATPDIGDDLTAFSNSASPLSNFYPATFKVDGLTYKHSEQYYQYHKAIFHDDLHRSQLILKENSPVKCKRLGDQVKIADMDRWRQECTKIMTTGCREKFLQKTFLRDFLLATSQRTLVEARNDDKYWGAGLRTKDPALLEPTSWPGQNQLGKVLMQLRQDFSQK